MKLNKLASEQEFDLIILDPIEIYLLDIDLGELKEWAKKKNIAILLSKYLSRPRSFQPQENIPNVLIFYIYKPFSIMYNEKKGGF